MGDSQLVTLLHLCDSLFPTGGFAHSDGLEAATSSGLIAAAEDLREWMDVCLEESLGRAEGPAVLLAWHAAVEREHDRLVAVDAEMHALRPSSTARQASRAMGRRLLKTWQQIHPHVALDAPVARAIDEGRLATLPVAFAVACASASIGVRAALEGFLYSRLAATVSCAMRLMPIGQHEAHGLLASTLARVPAVVDQLIARGEGPAAFAPALDVAVMSQQYVGSRLFLS